MSVGMPVIDVFSGGGGLPLGAHLAGFKTVTAIEVDADLSSSYAKNFPEVDLVVGDLQAIEAERLRVSGPFGMVGGPPCQGFSEIGRLADDDPRKTLLNTFCRRVAELNPSFFVIENVRGLLFERNRMFLSAALETIPSRYRVLEPMLLNAADYGAPTERKRVFIVGYAPDVIGHLDPATLQSSTVAEEAKTTVRDAFEGIGDAVLVSLEDGYDRWRMCAAPRQGSYAASLASEDMTFTGNRAVAHSAAVTSRFETVPEGGVDRVGRHPRLAWDGRAPTIRAGTGADKGSFQSVRPLHPSEPRVITVREAARLQGFPDQHLFHPTAWHSFRMIGNSVPPRMAAAVLSWIADAANLRQPSAVAAE